MNESVGSCTVIADEVSDRLICSRKQQINAKDFPGETGLYRGGRRRLRWNGRFSRWATARATVLVSPPPPPRSLTTGISIGPASDQGSETVLRSQKQFFLVRSPLTQTH